MGEISTDLWNLNDYAVQPFNHYTRCIYINVIRGQMRIHLIHIQILN